MAFMPDFRRSRLTMPMLRRRSPTERMVDAIVEGAGLAADAIVGTVRDARAAVADRSFPAVSAPAIALPTVSPARSAESIRARLPKPPTSGIPLPDVSHLPDASAIRGLDVRLPEVDLSALGGRVTLRASSKPRADTASPAPILGAVVAGMLAGMWLATWPVTATYVRAFFDGLRRRLGLADGWNADSARRALRRIDARTADWREGTRSRRRPRPRPGREAIGGVAVGPGHAAILGDDDGGMARTSDTNRALPWTAADLPPGGASQGDALLRSADESDASGAATGTSMRDAESSFDTAITDSDTTS